MPLELSSAAVVCCLLCTKEVVLEEELSPKTPNPNPGSGSSTSSSGSASAVKLISDEQCTSILFRHVLGRDLPPNIDNAQIKLCKNDSKMCIKFCNPCLTQLTHVHDLVAQLARVGRELKEQKADIVLKFCGSQVDPQQPNSATSAAAGLPENEEEELRIRNAISDGLKLLKPRSILAVVQNLKNRKRMRSNRPNLPAALAHAQPRHFPTRFGSSNSSSVVRLMKNVSIPRINSKTRLKSIESTARTIPEKPLISGDSHPDPFGEDTPKAPQNASEPQNAFTAVTATALGDTFMPDFDVSVWPKVEWSDLELEEFSTVQISPPPAARLATAMEYICGVCGTIFEDHASLKQHDDERHRHDDEDDDFKSFPGAALDHFPANPAAAVALTTSAAAAARRRRGSPKKRRRQNWYVQSKLHKKYKCPSCPGQFPNEWRLKRHLLVHGEDKPFQCPSPKCGKSFADTRHLQAHFKTLGGTPCAKFVGLQIHRTVKCALCPAAFVRQCELKRHLLRHSGEKRFQCPVPECPAKFPAEWNLKRHLLVHSGEKPFQCLTCGKSFTYKQNFQVHFKTPAGSQCAAAAQKTPNPPKVQSRSTRGKKYECEFCPAKFPNEWRLKRHLVVHSGEKPFQCHSCAKSFNYKHHLKAHLRSAAGASCAAKISKPVVDIDSQSGEHRSLRGYSVVDVGLSVTDDDDESCGGGRSFVQEEFLPDPDPNLYDDDDDLQDQDQDQILPDGIIEEAEVQGFSTSGSGQVLAHVPQVLTRFLCRLCGAIFEDSDSLEQHDKMHS